MISKSFEVDKKKVRGHSYCLFLLLLLSITNIFAQQTNNLQVIWVKGCVDSLYYCYGFDLGAGDFNGDGFSDIVVQGTLNPYPGIFQAYIFFGGHSFDTIPDVIISSDTTWGFIRTRGIGDINGDGFDDLALHAEYYPLPISYVNIYLGGNPMDTICDFKIREPLLYSDFGEAIGSGDVNGDGNTDLIVGAYWARRGFGAVYIFFGGPNFDTIPDVILNGGHHNDREGLGTTVAGGGDVNGDGISDVIIGAGNFGMIIQGRIYIYFGGNPMDTSYDVAMSGEGSWHRLGWFGVDLLINRNDYDYAIAGTPFGASGYERGKIYVLYGGPQMDSIPDVLMIGRFDTSCLGMSLCNAGFTSRTEASDLFAGAPGEYNYRGTAYLWLGGILLDTIPDAWMRGPEKMYNFGFLVASAGDVDGDGRDEIMISNPTVYSPWKVWVCKYTGLGTEEIATHSLAMTTSLEVYPNPASSVLRVRCPLSVKEVKVYDVSGKLVKRLEARGKKQEAGNYEIRWDLRDENKKRVANGIYFVEMIAEQEKEKIREIRKIIVTK